MSYSVQATKDSVTVEGQVPVTLRFTVANGSDRDLQTAVKLHVTGAVKSTWCTLQPAEDAVVRARDSAIYELTVKSPSAVGEPSSGTVALEAAWVQQPNVVFTQGPQIAVTVVPARDPVDGWWKKWWKLLAAGAAAVIVIIAVGLWLFLDGSDVVEIRKFVVEPDTALPGTQVELKWQIGGQVASAFLRIPGSDDIPIEGPKQAEGSYTLTLAYPPGVHAVQVVALDGTEKETGKPAKMAQASITVQKPPPTPEPPKIEAFTVSPSSVESGQQVTFTWRLSGGIGRAVIDLGDNTMVEIAADHRANGTFSRAFLPGQQRVTLRALSTDLQVKVEDTKVVQVRAIPQAPDVKRFTLQGLNPKSVPIGLPVGVPPVKLTIFSAVRVQWEVSGNPTSIKVRLGGKEQALSGNSGSQDLVLGNMVPGATGELVVGMGGRDLVVQTQVNKPGFALKFNPATKIQHR